ncbi:MAG TPA: dTDP-4-amino-4,6-dideoxygalactose transaminase [Bryobacteraceae bacterium]|nr:dTDP-4-amino-4,6-dideoxygalactose transaminase [Bryobacteraceae bacterium]HUO29785.1 dTDP-4-amino-4,6-dideoxygalactose transaminase [Bryobacteraceae bacterium]
MSNYRIPFNRPTLTGKELDYIHDALRQGHSAGDGPFTASCQRLLEAALGAPRVLLTTSCTHALEMAALLLKCSPEDEIVVPSFTFVSTANAFALRGARLVFADIRPDTLNLDENLLPALLTARTRAIVPVHYAGIACELESILALARSHGCAVIEDNAHGLYAKYQGRHLGTFGAVATQSFHETKNVTCGEGGALVINDASLIERAEILREKGTNRSRFFRGEIDKYTWVDIGSSYPPSDILAAFLLAQLEAYERIRTLRCAVWHRYDEGLRDWARQNGVRQPRVPDGCEQSFHMYYLLMPSLASRRNLIEFLKRRGILAVFHYVPLHLSEMGLRLGGRKGQCPVTESVSDRLVRLPFYNSLSESDQAEVIDSIHSFDEWAD